MRGGPPQAENEKKLPAHLPWAPRCTRTRCALQTPKLCPSPASDRLLEVCLGSDLPSSSEGDFFSHLCAFKSCLSSCVSRQLLSPACFPHGAPLTALAAGRWVTLLGPRAVSPLVSRGRTECGLWFQLQVNLLSKFLLIAKSCYEQRNFATAMQILGGLEHVAVRQSPVSRPPEPRAAGRHVGSGVAVGGSPVLSFQAWRILPAKIAEVMEELKAVEVGALRAHFWPPGAPGLPYGRSLCSPGRSLGRACLAAPRHPCPELVWSCPSPRGAKTAGTDARRTDRAWLTHWLPCFSPSAEAASRDLD